MRYFLTGATGFIGGRLAAQLRAADHEVVALVRNPNKAESQNLLAPTAERAGLRAFAHRSSDPGASELSARGTSCVRRSHLPR